MPEPNVSWLLKRGLQTIAHYLTTQEVAEGALHHGQSNPSAVYRIVCVMEIVCAKVSKETRVGINEETQMQKIKEQIKEQLLA
ncbi:MAG: hypothetical protein ACXAEN_14725 [Candidatus Thorarchaeota archaeon]|jgi:hypothetical protein